MIAVQYIPPAPLSEFVDRFWYWDANTLSHAKERLLPDGSMTLVFNLGQDQIRLFDPCDMSKFSTLRGHTFSGAHSGFFVVDTENMVNTVGIHFKPGGAFPFLTMPASDLSDLCIGLEELWGEDARRIRDRLLEPSSPAAKFQLLERWLLSRLAKPLKRHLAVDFAMGEFVRHRSALPVSTVAERLGYSQRRLNQLFSQEVGLSPKLFSRIRRFQRVIHDVAGQREIDWTGVALSCGYYDQAHFIHEFQEFCGLTPSAYLERRTEHLNHVPVA
jgi:AraC-like DNA-binding protein